MERRPDLDPESLLEQVRQANTAAVSPRRLEQRAERKKRHAKQLAKRERRLRSPLRMKMSLRVGSQELHFLCLQLRAYLTAGFPVTEAWRRCAESTNHPLLRPTCRRIHEDLVAGKTLRAALERHRGKLPPFFIEMVVSGDHAGSLEESLGHLQRHYAWLFHIRGDIIRAVSYLLIVLLLGKVIFALRGYFLQGIHEAQQRGQTSGLPDEPMRTLAAHFAHHFIPVIIAVVAAYALALLMAQTKRARFALDVVTLALPLIGGIIREAVTINFCRCYVMLQGAGLMPSNTYRNAAASMGNRAMEKRLLQWAHFVDHGEPVAEAMKRAKILPRDTRAMLEIGDVAASEVPLTKIAEFSSVTLQAKVRALTRLFSALAPILIAVLFFVPFLISPFGLPTYDIVIGFVLFTIFML